MTDVLVLASLNADLVVPVAARPGGGETALGGDLVVHPGGKGANQAAAAALAGARVRVAGRVGEDAHGAMLRARLADVGADVEHVLVTPGVASGVALILVTPDGENSIVVAPGANARVGADDLPALTAATVAVAQLEVPLAAVVALAERCVQVGARLVLNAAPPRDDLPGAVLRACDPLVVNAHEAAALTGTAVPATTRDAVRAAHALRALGARSVVLTLGGDGALTLDGDACWQVPAPRVDAVVDTTGAGDCLVGTLAARLAAGDDLATAASDAVRTATLAVLRPGAQSSYVPRAQALTSPAPVPVSRGRGRGRGNPRRRGRVEAVMTDLAQLDHFFVKQKITVMANRYEIRAAAADGGEGPVVAVAQQKRFAFKEQVTFYADEAKKTPVFGFRARQRMDLGATYDVTDASGATIGFFRKQFGKSLLRSTWELGVEGGPTLVGRERSQNVAIARRAWELLPVVSELPSPFVFHFDFTDESGQVLMSSVRKRSLRDRYDVTVPGGRVDGRVAAAMAVALDALQSR